jgi:type II secretory pathway component PulC
MLANKYLAAVIGILLILVIAYNIKFFSSKKVAPQTPVVKKTELEKRSSPDTVKVTNRTFVQKDRHQWKRDPFGLVPISQKIVKTAKKEPEKDFAEDIQLIGIIKRDGRSYALINGKVYSKDDRIGDIVIKEIRKHSVVLASGEKTEEISFKDYIVLKETPK